MNFGFEVNKTNEANKNMYNTTIEKIKSSIVADREARQQQEEDLKDLKLQVFEDPMKFVDAIIKELPSTPQTVGVMSISTIDNTQIVAKQHARELLNLLDQLRSEAKERYSQAIGKAYFNNDKKEESDKALAKYHEFGKCIDKLEKLI